MTGRRRTVNLTPLALPQDARIVAVVGCSKNAGKTTTLNALLAGLDDVPNPGVLSIGIDGEEADFWLGVPKPRVEVREGDFVATAEAALAAGTARIEICGRTGGHTLLGDLVVGRVTGSGSVLLAGIRAKDDVRAAVDTLRRLGVTRVLIDGAYQRLAAADPEVSDGTILATGAVLGTTVELVALRTQEFLQRLRVPASDIAGDRVLMNAARSANRFAFQATPGGEVVVADSPAEPAARRILQSGEAVIAIPGAVGDDLLLQCAALSAGRLRLLAQDPTRLFLSAREVAAFQRRHALRVIRPIRVLAVTVNPFSVLGWTLPREALVEAVRAKADGLPVVSFDVHPHPT
jgi:hypothetical protein